jgi:DNA-binding NarL/FixJ family response regulator
MPGFGTINKNDEKLHPAVEAHKPDLVSLDLWLNSRDGLETIRTLKSRFPSLRILVLSQFDEMLYAERVLRAGASGYVTKEQGVKEVLTAIRTVLAGERYVSSKIAALVLHKMVDARQGSRNRAVENLTDRELQILGLRGAGLSTRKIAEGLHVSFKTVETHRENIKHKLGLSDAVELVRYAANWGRGLKPSTTAKIAT